MHNRKRQYNTQKLNSDLCKCDVISSNDELNECEFVTKFSKYQPIDLKEDEFHKSYFATPGECTRSKTIKFNPFDLSNPEPKNTNFNNFICSPPQKVNILSKNKYQSISNCSYEDSLDSGFETESILSFASRSTDEENSNSNLSDIRWSENSRQLLIKQREISSPVNNCSETGYLLPIVTDSSNDNVLIPQISPMTLANILSGNHTLNNNVKVFDCRFPYEYAGGHIANAINVHTCQKLLQTLFPVKKSCSNRKLEEDISNLRKKLKRDDSIYVFYCEFSSYRAPKLAQCLRGLDRLAHFGSRSLFIPNIYVLFGGYRDFYNEYWQFCTPNAYVQMKQTRYPLRNSLYDSENESELNTEITKNQYRKEEKQYFREVQDTEKKLRFIITKSTKDSDILQLFLSHPVIGGS